MEKIINDMDDKINFYQKIIDHRFAPAVIANELLSLKDSKLTIQEQITAKIKLMQLHILLDDIVCSEEDIAEKLTKVQKLLNTDLDTSKDFITIMMDLDSDNLLEKVSLCMLDYKDVEKIIDMKITNIVNAIIEESTNPKDIEEKLIEKFYEFINLTSLGSKYKELCGEEIEKVLVKHRDNNQGISKEESTQTLKDLFRTFVNPFTFGMYQKEIEQDEQTKDGINKMLNLADKLNVDKSDLSQFLIFIILIPRLKELMLYFSTTHMVMNDYEMWQRENPEKQFMNEKKKFKEFLESPLGSQNRELYFYCTQVKKRIERLCSTISQEEQKKKKIYGEQEAKIEKIKHEILTANMLTEISCTHDIQLLEDLVLQRKLLEYIYQHNNTVMKYLSQEYNEMLLNPEKKYQRLLEKNGINVSNEELKSVMRNSVDTVSNMLLLLKSNFYNKEIPYIEILKRTDIKTLEAIISLYKQEVIGTDFLDEHLDVFNKESEDYKNLKANITLVNELGINPKELNTYPDAFIINAKTFANNMEHVKEYNYLDSLKETTNYNFLGQENIDEQIDFLIELGYGEMLDEDLELLNYSQYFDRLKILKELNIKVEDENDLIDILTTNKFYVSDSKIDEYVYNEVDRQKEFLIDENNIDIIIEPLDLSEYESERTYTFGDVIISKQKVKKNIDELSDTEKANKNQILYAIVKGSILTTEEYVEVAKSIGAKKALQEVRAKTL